MKTNCQSDYFAAIRFRYSRRHGFTLIEMVAVLVVLAVLAALAIGRLPDSNAALGGERDLLASHLRHTQLRALADIADWELRFVTSNTYQIGPLDGAGNFSPVTIPGTTATSRSLANGIAVSGSPAIRFDPWGRPVDSGGNPLTSPFTFELISGGASLPITLQAETGFIP